MLHIIVEINGEVPPLPAFLTVFIVQLISLYVVYGRVGRAAVYTALNLLCTQDETCDPALLLFTANE